MLVSWAVHSPEVRSGDPLGDRHPRHSLQEEGPGHGVPVDVGPVEERVEVGQQGVAQAQGPPHGLLGLFAEPVWLLGLGGAGTRVGTGSGARSCGVS